MTESRPVFAWSWVGRREGFQKSPRKPLGLIVAMFSWMCTYGKTYQSLHLNMYSLLYAKYISIKPLGGREGGGEGRKDLCAVILTSYSVPPRH